LKAAIARYFQGVSWQRCQVHYGRNLLGMVSFAKRKELGADLRGIFARHFLATLEAIPRACSLLVAAKGNEKVAEHLEEHVEECLT
jgi:transposase-like protein